MKLLGGFLALGVVPIVDLTCAQVVGGSGRPSAVRAGMTRFAEEAVSDVGVAQVHAIAHEDEEVGECLVEKLQADGQATVVREVEVGQLWCDSLNDAPDSTLLRFAISSNETVVAERTYFSTVDGSVLADGKERKVWMGDVVDPEPFFSRTVSMTWADPCDVESFLLKVESANFDGSTTITQSIPCEAGSSTEFCVVELAVALHDEDYTEPIRVDEQSFLRRLNTDESIHDGALPGRQGDAAIKPSGRGLQDTTIIDLMVLYDEKAWSPDGSNYTLPVLLTRIVEGIQETNQAFVNSEVTLKLELAHVGQLPYYLTTKETGDELGPFRVNSDVIALRNLYRADLVMLVGWLTDGCGVAYIGTHEAFGFSAISAHCFASKAHSHELGHNFGCEHTREQMDPWRAGYRHAHAQCTGDVRFSTILAIGSGCPPVVNYFSNPDVQINGTSTGNATTSNNAQRIRDRMEPMSHYRDPCVTPGTACAWDYECCLGSCVEGVCAEVSGCLNPEADAYKCTSGAGTTLDLAGCGITDSEVNGGTLRACFAAFGSLRIDTLKLNENELSSLPTGVFDGLGSLRILHLEGNALTTLSSGVFDVLGSLTMLYLNKNGLITLPEGVFDELGSLTNLFLHDNELATLHYWVFDQLASLNELFLQTNQLTTLPFGVFDALGSLTILHMDSNQLECLQPVPTTVTTLVVDDSVDGVYCAGPTACLDSKDPAYKCISRNDTTLDLEGCGITDFDVDSLPLRACFDAFGQSNIDFLKLNGNELSSLSAGVFDGLESLRILYLHENALTTLSNGVFDGIGPLSKLYLQTNDLTTLPDGIFDGLGSLTHLNLQTNDLTTLPDGIFDGLGSLTHLDLGMNQLQCLPTVPRSVTDLSVDNSIDGEYCDSGRTCSNGIVGVEGRISNGQAACCPLTCLNDDGEPQCGNNNCYDWGEGNNHCCVGPIHDVGEDCAVSGEAPCFIAGESTPTPEPTLPDTPAPSTPLSNPDEEYIGCFKDDKKDRVMAHKIFDDEEMTAAHCREHCADKDAPYYGTQWSIECWCGTSSDEADYERHGTGTCDWACSGDEDEACGGYWAFSLYKYDTPETSKVCSEPVEMGEQCGGDGWTGSTCCADGLECVVVGTNTSYSQCHPLGENMM